MRLISLAGLGCCGLLLTGVGCDHEGIYEPDLVFTSGIDPTAAAAVDGADITSVGRGVLVSGTLLTPNQCYELAPTLTRANAVVVLTMNASLLRSTCAEPGVGFHTYAVSTTRYRPGEYLVRVVHIVAGTGEGKAVAEQTVEIR